jgi:hypothetical protein
VSNPRLQHGKALKWLGRNLIPSSRDKGMIYSPSNQSFDVDVDASFTGDQESAEWDPGTARSRPSYVILYAPSCPVIWASKLQSEIALSTTESKNLPISASTREVLPLMELVQEMQDHECSFQAQQGQDLAMSSFTLLHVQSYGLPSYNLRLLYQQLRAKIWQFQQPQERCFH